MTAESVASRVVTGLFGFLLVALAVLTIVTSGEETRAGALLVALVLGALGVDAVISAARDRRSLVSRIGPLP
jgi:thiol:disulfide interchange protein